MFTCAGNDGPCCAASEDENDILADDRLEQAVSACLVGETSPDDEVRVSQRNENKRRKYSSQRPSSSNKQAADLVAHHARVAKKREDDLKAFKAHLSMQSRNSGQHSYTTPSRNSSRRGTTRTSRMVNVRSSSHLEGDQRRSPRGSAAAGGEATRGDRSSMHESPILELPPREVGSPESQAHDSSGGVDHQSEEEHPPCNTTTKRGSTIVPEDHWPEEEKPQASPRVILNLPPIYEAT